jgi:Uri superfamily endonuclease
VGARHVREYGDQDRDRWHTDWFQRTLNTIDIDVLRWEDMVGTIGEHDADSGDAIKQFYDLCVAHNQ